MKLGRFSRAKLLSVLVSTCTVVFLTGCDAFGGPQNTFSPDGEVADKQKDLFLISMWPALVIGVLVFVALVYIMVRFRHREGSPPPQQLHGNTRIEVAWTIAPALLLLGIAVPTLQGIFDLGRAPASDALSVEVEGFRFGWTFEYLDPEYALDSGNQLKVDREMHVPVGREIGIYLESPDVIHSFWVPKLAGKTDVIPGRTNRMWFKADRPGTYSGQCAELCGIGHAGMRFTVVAHAQEDFDAWVDEQMSDSPPPPPEGDPPGEEAPPEGEESP
jgi:cytochrome c oxidase subunit 2